MWKLLRIIVDSSNRFMGGITGFLVFASLLSSIFDSLPKSAEMKLADVWLLFFMIMIILVIILHIIIEFQQRRGSQLKVATESFKYPPADLLQRSRSHRTNNTAKVLLPLVIAVFLLVYIFLSTKIGRCAILTDQTDCGK